MTEEPKPEEGSNFAVAMMAEGDDKKEKLKKAATELRQEMEASGAKIQELVLAQPPTELLGYLWSKIFLGFMKRARENGDDASLDSDLIQEFQFVLEYVHAVWSGHKGEFAKTKLDEAKVAELMETCGKLKTKSMFYAMASSQIGELDEFGDATPDVEFQAKSTWVLIRGHRYQVLEKEFFNFALAPHEEALKKAYDVGAAEIADGIQSVADSIRTGYTDAAMKLHGKFDECQKRAEAEGISIEEAAAKFKSEDADYTTAVGAAMKDMLFGDICNLSKHTKLPESVLEDMAFAPGTDETFFADGDYKGTPFRTLPARIKPLVKLEGGYYATDGQFVRDTAYRAIQRGLIARLPDYKEGWNKNQKAMTETAFTTILEKQLKGARVFEEVYFKDPSTGAWAETDLVGAIDDVLFVAEAKAGVMAMQSPATNFASHIRTIRELVLKAYRQCKRFLDYLAGGTDMPIYRLKDGNYDEVAKLNLRDFRLVLPLGLTVEAFTPFSSMCKEIPEIVPILGRHPFVSMSVDDLLVLNRFLPSAGSLFHYLEVRQAIAGIPQAMIFDELDHIGAYIVRNRFDQDIREQLKEADRVTWDSFSHVVDKHFQLVDWEAQPVPSQQLPGRIAAILEVLDTARPKGWLLIDSEIRNYSDEGRNDVNGFIDTLSKSLPEYPVRRMLIGNMHGIQIWLTTSIGEPSPDEMRYQAEVACLAFGKPSVITLRLQCSPEGKPLVPSTSKYAAPSILRQDYAQLKAEADRQMSRNKGKRKK
ncbi:hypothetical protein [Undibacter mobilis]|uniref:Uncharacterized protein n=1 Tax=Undibacter mobilis TaxID=2292256 RepID=A0A371BA97_9BRAD|nr:hypothetical protein [Undibacter mobilis]RDV04500.1 hypothetical protein DXH78_07950 [Undibacter mobilis]